VHTSGIITFTGLCHDFVLRRNVRVAFSRVTKSDFISSTHGSHHVHLVDGVAKLFNRLRLEEKATSICCLPELKEVPSKEHFGLIKSGFASTFGGLLDIKAEDSDSPVELDMTGPKFLEALGGDGDAVDLVLQPMRSEILEELNIDPQLLSMPQVPSDAQPSLRHSHATAICAAEVAGDSSEATSSEVLTTTDARPRPMKKRKADDSEPIVISESEPEDSDRPARTACEPPRKIMRHSELTTSTNVSDALEVTACPSNKVSS
jgi:hypothetical protein